jgi:hypothetical protein
MSDHKRPKLLKIKTRTCIIMLYNSCWGEILFKSFELKFLLKPLLLLRFLNLLKSSLGR